MNNTKSTLLQQCQRYFPGLAWDIDQDGDLNAEFYGIDFYFSPETDGTFLASILFPDRRAFSWEERGFPTAAKALAAASARWREFVAEAIALTTPEGKG